MLGFCRSFREGDCLHVDEGGGLSLDLIVKNISGPRESRTAIIEIVENGMHSKYKEIHQSRIDDKALFDGFYVKIPNDSKSKNGRVIISYSYITDYKVSFVSRKKEGISS